MLVATFRGAFDDVTGSLDLAGDRPRLVGEVDVASIRVKDENLYGHLQSPEFFDAAATPKVTFVSDSLVRDGDDVTLEGDLTIKGTTHRVTAKGTWLEIEADVTGNPRIGIDVDTPIDRTPYALDCAATLPQAADLPPSAVSVNVMSKSYGLPGLRVGWVAAQDRALLDRLERPKHYTSICNPGLPEHLAAIALSVGGAVHARNRAIVAANITLVRDFFADFPDRFEFEAPAGGCVSFPRYLGAEGPEVFARSAIEEAGVLTLPASIYASALADVPTARIRIGFGRTSLPATLAALRSYLENQP